ncbi:ubiquitin-specific protease ubp15, partial [Coemansia aciculifera]
MTLGEFNEWYAKHTGISVNEFRMWSLVGRINKTTRCDVPLVAECLTMTLEQLKESKALKLPELRLYCEMRTEDSPDDFGSRLPLDLSLIHLRFYDPSRSLLTGVGHMYIEATQMVRDIMPHLREAAVLSPDTPIALYEEVKPTLIDRLNLDQTFRKAEISTGDIICFQVLSEADNSSYRHPTVVSYFDELQHRVCVRFVPRPARNDVDEFSNGNGDESAEDGSSGTVALSPELTISSRTPYDNIAQWLAKQLGMRDPLKLRFYTVGPSGQPRTPVRRAPATKLADMLPNSLYGQLPFNDQGVPEYTVMYERLEVDIMQIESMRSIRITYVGKSMKEELQLEVLVPKAGPPQKLVEAAYSKVETALRSVTQRNGDAAPPKPFALRLYVVTYHRINHVLDGFERMTDLGNPGLSDIIAEHLSPEDSLEVTTTIMPRGADDGSGSDSSGMRMETNGDVVIVEEKGGNSAVIEVFHFYRELNHAHSVPFLFNIYPGEL